MDGKQRKVRMKKLISFKQKYNPNDVVFAISFSKEDPDNDDFDANYAKIYKVRYPWTYLGYCIKSSEVK